jgi:hypothetical protein
MSVNPSGVGESETQIAGVKSVRSANYTISAADISASWTQPIEVLFVDNQGNPAPYADTNYTVSADVEQIFGVNAPKALYSLAQFQRMTDQSGAGNGRSQGIIAVVQLLTNAKAGDVIVVHVIAIHD